MGFLIFVLLSLTAQSIKIFDLQPALATFTAEHTHKTFQMSTVDPDFAESKLYTMSIWVQKRVWTDEWEMFMRLNANM